MLTLNLFQIAMIQSPRHSRFVDQSESSTSEGNDVV